MKLPTTASLILLASCAPTLNLLNPTSPRFEGSYAQRVPAATSRIRVVSFNIKLADEIERAIKVLQSDSLRDADIISLQEMDETGVDRIARALHLNYVYYPGSIHPTRHRYFGPAILTRWPMEQSWKIVLPHEAPIRHQRRNATAALIDVAGQCVRVYAVHLETQLKATQRERESQVDAVLGDAAGSRCPVVIAGDFNSKRIGNYLKQHGYGWPTRDVGRTISFFSWDHIFVHGMGLAQSPGGQVREVHGASDHHPVWASLILREIRSGARLSAITLRRDRSGSARGPAHPEQSRHPRR